MNSIKTGAALLAVVAASGFASGSLINNGSFDAPVDYSGNPFGNWTAFFGGADFQQVEIVAEATASNNSALQIGTFNTVNTFAGVTQQVAGIIAGEEYTFSFDARNVLQNGYAAEYRIEWKDAGGAFVGGQFDLNTNLDASLTDVFQTFSLAAIAPAGATQASVVIAIQTFGGASVAAPYEGFFQVDSASFVPAPAGVAVLGLGGLAAARRRRG